MTTVRIEIDEGAFNAFRNSAAVTAVCTAAAERIKAAATARITDPKDGGEPFYLHVSHNRTRVAVLVGTANFDGREAEARDRILTSALYGGAR